MSGRSRTVLVERLKGRSPLPLPARGTALSACFDIVASETVRLDGAAVRLVATGFRMRAPKGTFIEIRPRSGLSTKGVLMVNTPGTIDRDYSGEIRVPLTYLFQGGYTIRAGDRIAQVRIVEELPVTFREGRVRRRSTRSGGFGSTGR